jgi:cytochrome c5
MISVSRVLCGALGAMIALIGVAAAQRIELPAGPNRELVSRECQACHDLGMVVGATGLTRDGWANILAEMTTYGMNATPDDQAKIVDYLSIYLGPR